MTQPLRPGQTGYNQDGRRRLPAAVPRLTMKGPKAGGAQFVEIPAP
ncbi:hypothetical protein Cadr_000014826 [Camelus dromedarius]|uniref:Uncharacterized protein n=1 Tax=Camelus dromedarius TaxID=9838 RepID=A0A5N4DMW1_CAMDR|nr:hypothetical protein Cadr_000014826 [Camelus dromedarius]